ncbi:hypothetical protein ABZ128_34200 [Streptomyces sp. NPDC006326]|uniref:hypothetical protein n=1 Tax=Streptomyces sp. NPDC006326 TaxID=3156752 RepID=UPI0033A06A33
MSGLRGVAVGLAVGALGGLLTGFAAPQGNGVEDDSAQVIVQKARKALDEARSVRMKAQVEDAAGTTTLDLRFDVDGNCTGAVGLPRGGGHADIVKRGQDVWLKPDAKFFQSQVPGSGGKDAAELINGRWIHGSTRNALLREFSEVCDLSGFQRKYASKPASESLAKGGKTTVGGAEAITVTSRSEDESSTYYVATEGKPRLLRVEGGEDGRKGKADFSEYDKPVPAATPRPGESVDLSQLQ